VKAAADRVVETGRAPSLLTEDIIPHPIGPYGESKIKAEEYIQSQLSIINCQLSIKKSVYILRPCMIHGPGNKGNLNLLYKVVSKGIPWPLGAFENRRSFMNIRNLSYIVEQFILQNPESGIYFITCIAQIGTFCKLPFNSERLRKLTENYVVSNQKMKTALEITHLPVDVRTGLKHTLETFG